MENADLGPGMKWRNGLSFRRGLGQMDASILEVLKQDVAKWEEAANAVQHWLPKVHEGDRQQLIDRGRQYKTNAAVMRAVIEQLHPDTN